MRKLMAAVAVGLLALTGCGAQEGLPQPSSGNSARPLVADEKYAQMLGEAQDGIKAADESLDATKLGDRIGEPLRSQRAAELKLKSILADSYTLPPLHIDPNSAHISSGVGFPRSMMVISAPAEGQNLSSLAVWSQDGARGRYRLWADVELYPGNNVPLIVSAQDDVQLPTADDLAFDPSQVLAAYASYNGTRQQQAIPFVEADPLYTQIAGQQDTLVQAVGNLGTSDTNFEAADTGTRMVATEDGGVVVVGTMKYTVVITRTAENGKLRVGAQIGALATGSADQPLEVAKQASAVYSVNVAFYVPAKGKGESVSVIGASEPALMSVDNQTGEE